MIRICQQHDHVGIVDHLKLNLLPPLRPPYVRWGSRRRRSSYRCERKCLPLSLLIPLYYDGLFYASCPPVTFLCCCSSTVPSHYMVLLDQIIYDGWCIFVCYAFLFPLVKGMPSPIVSTSSLCSLTLVLSSLFVSTTYFPSQLLQAMVYTPSLWSAVSLGKTKNFLKVLCLLGFLLLLYHLVLDWCYCWYPHTFKASLMVSLSFALSASSETILSHLCKSVLIKHIFWWKGWCDLKSRYWLVWVLFSYSPAIWHFYRPSSLRVCPGRVRTLQTPSHVWIWYCLYHPLCWGGWSSPSWWFPACLQCISSNTWVCTLLRHCLMPPVLDIPYRGWLQFVKPGYPWPCQSTIPAILTMLPYSAHHLTYEKLLISTWKFPGKELELFVILLNKYQTDESL